MLSSTAEIKRLLKANQFYKMQAANGLGGDLREKLDFLEKAISALNAEDLKLIRGVYIEKIPVARIAKSLFLHRASVYRRADMIIEKLAEVYDLQFGA